MMDKFLKPERLDVHPLSQNAAHEWTHSPVPSYQKNCYSEQYCRSPSPLFIPSSAPLQDQPELELDTQIPSDSKSEGKTKLPTKILNTYAIRATDAVIYMGSLGITEVLSKGVAKGACLVGFTGELVGELVVPRWMEGGLLWDYLVFGTLIVGSFSVAIYGKFSGPKEKTKNDFAFAKSNSVSMISMMLSIARGFLGVRVFLGYPSELYYRGSAMWEVLYGMIIAFPVVLYVFVPVYYSLGITSVYQYLDLRFKSRLVRCLASFTYVFRNLLNNAVTVFTPCVALKTIFNLPYWASISMIVGISIFFTIMGGLRTAIMADVTQLLVMTGCSLIIILQGTIEAGGVTNVVNASYTHDRLQFFNFDMDPSLRVTTVSAIIGQFFMSLSIFGCQQNFVQRYCSMSSQSKVNKTIWANIPIMTVLFSLSWIVGMVIFANYLNCDPKMLGYISDNDEIVAFYVEDKFIFLPGFLGLVLACLFNGALNLMVSNLNSLAVVTWEDFFFQIPACKKMSERTQLWMMKGVGVILGLIMGAVAFLVSKLSGVIEAQQFMTSSTSGPLLGVFLLAMLVPPANWKGAAVGMLASHAIVMWITFGRLTTDIPPIPSLPVSVEGCTNTTFSANVPPLPPQNHSVWTEDFEIDPIVGPAKDEGDFLYSIYSMTYMYYSMVGTLITVIVGTIVSLVTASESDRFDEKLCHPWARKVYRLCPGKRSCFLNLEQVSATNPQDKLRDHKI